MSDAPPWPRERNVAMARLPTLFASLRMVDDPKFRT